MGLRFHIKFPDDLDYTEITQYIKYDSVQFKSALLNDKFEFVQDSVSAITIYDKAISTKFFTAKTWMPAYVTFDKQDEQMYGYDGVNAHGFEYENYGFLEEGRIFTGAIYPNTKEKLTDYPSEGVSFEIVDNSYLLDVDCETFQYPETLGQTWKVFDPSNKTYSVIHQLLYKVGLDDSMISPIGSITKIINHVSKKEEEDTYLNIINDMLYEHHHVAYFDENGIFCIYDWKHATIDIDKAITEDDIQDNDGVIRERNIIDYDGYKITYSETDTKQQALVYRESIDEDGVLILADTYFPVEGMAKDIYQSYTTKYLPEDTKILSTFNHVLESDKDDGILVHSQLYENEQAKVLFKNVATESQRLFQFDIRADVLYANGEDELVVPSTAKKLEDISFKYVHDGDDAKEFANSLHNNIIRNGNYKYKFTSTNNYMLGNKYNLITRDYNKNVLIIGKSWNDYTKAYKYECVQVEQRVISTMRTRSFRMSSTQTVLPPLARIITLTGDSPNILYSSRGTLLTQEVIFTVGVTNIDLNSVVWDCNIGNEYLEDILDEFGNPILNKKVLLTDTITEGVVVVTVYAIIDEHTYSASYSVSVVSEGLPTPLYLGALEDVPLVTDEGPLYKGDFFLYIGGTAPIAPDKNSEEYLNPQLAEVNEFIYGRMYEFVGVDELGIDLWEETRKSECFASAQKDALEIAKNSNVYLYCAVVVAQLGLFNDLMVANILESTNYDYYKESDRDTNPASPTYNKIIGLDGKEHELGEPKKGFQLDGPKDIIKAFAMEAYNSKIFGTVESTGFKTLTGTDPITIPRITIPKNIWKYSDMFLDSLIANQDTFYAKSGTIEGFAFTQATKRYNTRIKIASTSPYSRGFGAGAIATMGTIYPDFVFGRSIYVVARGKYAGNFSGRVIGYNGINLMTIYNQPLQIGSNGVNLVSHLDKSFDFRRTLTMPSGTSLVKVVYGNNAWWGNVTGYLYELSAYTSRTFNGLILRNGNNTKIIAPQPNAYYPNTKTWNIGTANQNTYSNYCSGTEFYNKFYQLPSVADGYINAGKIKVKKVGQPLTEYTVTRLVKDGNGISFYSDKGIIRVDKFTNGTSNGVYEHLEITQAIEFKTVPDGIEVKSVLPWGTFVQDVDNVTIGTVDARFESGYFNYLDILKNMLVRGDLNVNGTANSNYINTGNGSFKIGQNLRTTDSPTFAGLTLKGWEHKRKTYKYQPPVNGYVYIDAMEIGETRVCTFGPLGTTTGDDIEGVYLPSGGVYHVNGQYSNVNGVNYTGAIVANNQYTDLASFQLFAGGGLIASDAGSSSLDIYNAYFIITRVS